MTVRRNVRILVQGGLIAALAAAAFAGPVAAAETTAFERITGHYEAIRQALVKDSMDGVAAHATAIRSLVVDLKADFATEGAGAAPGTAAECQALLPSLSAAATRLEQANDLAGARAAFAELTQPLLEYRKMATGERPVVVYCSMAKKKWLQPEGEIGNPYLGQKMARCGQVVAR